MMLSDYYMLSSTEARALLEAFVQHEATGLHTLAPQLLEQGNAVFALEMIPSVIARCAALVHTTKGPIDDSTPDWLRRSDVYQRNHFAFTSESVPLITAAGYYFGETFCRLDNRLIWTIGSPDYAFKNMPVVSGFTGPNELPALMVAENQVRSLITRERDVDSVRSIVEFWAARLPNG